MSQSLILRGSPETDRPLIDTFLANLRKSIEDARVAGLAVTLNREDHTEPVLDGCGSLCDLRYLGATFTISVPTPENLTAHKYYMLPHTILPKDSRGITVSQGRFQFRSKMKGIIGGKREEYTNSVPPQPGDVDDQPHIVTNNHQP